MKNATRCVDECRFGFKTDSKQKLNVGCQEALHIERLESVVSFPWKAKVRRRRKPLENTAQRKRAIYGWKRAASREAKSINGHRETRLNSFSL
jgi:hypothetical protein